MKAIGESKETLFKGSANAPWRVATWVGEPIDVDVEVCGLELAEGSGQGDANSVPIDLGGRISVEATATKGAEVQSLSPKEKAILRPGECAIWTFSAMNDEVEGFDLNVTVATLWGTTNTALDNAELRTSVGVYRTEGDMLRMVWGTFIGVLALAGAVATAWPLVEKLSKARRNDPPRRRRRLRRPVERPRRD